MADFSMITARLATGAAITSPDDVAALAAAGITDVIDCRGEFDDAPLSTADIWAWLRSASWPLIPSVSTLVQGRC